MELNQLSFFLTNPRTSPSPYVMNAISHRISNSPKNTSKTELTQILKIHVLFSRSINFWPELPSSEKN